MLYLSHCVQLNISYRMLVLLVILYVFSNANGQECRTGFFGLRCQYKCHCESKQCDNEGNCIGYSRNCETGWFGLKCQYQNLAINASITPYYAMFLANNTSWFCSTFLSLKSINLTWTTGIAFSWLRIKIANLALLQNYSLTFLPTISSSWIECIKQRLSQIDFNTFDIHCDTNVAIYTIKLEGDLVGSLCFLYINGGRNMALLQSDVRQTSQYLTFRADFAVDGFIMKSCYEGHCSHTNTTDITPKWRIQFDRPYCINRFILYNRVDDRQDRLRHFSLQAMNADQIVFRHTDSSTIDKTIYNVLFPNSTPITTVTVSQTKKYSRDPVPYVTLNEFVAYGECVPGYWGLDCRETCSDLCQHSCHLDDGTCRDVCFGYTDPPTCSQKCTSGQWGLNCSRQCSSSCYNSDCDHLKGTCKQGCYGYNNAPICSLPCPKNKFGLNCLETCSSQCLDQTCNSTSGKCNSCIEGFKGDYCNQTCEPTRFGFQCSQICNTSCLDQKCYPTNGTCIRCPIGNTGGECYACPFGTYGHGCENNCSQACINQTCDVTKGECQLGCISGYNGIHCELYSADETGSSIEEVGVIAGTVIGVVLLIVIVVSVTLALRRGIIVKEITSTGENPNASRLSIVFEQDEQGEREIITPRTSKQPGLYVNSTALSSTSIDVCKLYSLVKTKDVEYFKQQFQLLPEVENVTTEAGLKDENRPKNRFKNILPYDHSRVHLEINSEKKDGDFINASYIKDFKGVVKFIASQGPNEFTVNDFIRMLWEQKTEKVAMLTNLIEEAKVKCEKYWPEDKKKIFGDIQLKLIATQTFADYTIRKIEMSMKDQMSRQLTHFHFTSWPDKGLPTSSWTLVDFEQRVFSTPSSQPVVVHCSAGVGRTGTFIALRNVMTEAEQTGRVNFYNTVSKLRQDRMWMVQTAEQYEFLHRAALASIVCMGKTLSAQNIIHRLKTLNTAERNSQIRTEYEFITNVCAVSERFIPDSEEKDNKENVYQNVQHSTKEKKNRFSEILPNATYRAHLSCYSTYDDDYINAVLVPSLKERDHYILSQLPMPTTVTDFWRLVIQYNVSLVVAFEVDAMAADQTFGNYLPVYKNQMLLCAPFQIKSLHIKEESLWQEQQLSISLEKSQNYSTTRPMVKESHSLIHIKSKLTDFDPDKLLHLIKEIRQHQSTDGKVLYLCRNGATYSGLACVLTQLLDRMDNDSFITVPLVVGSVKSIRPQVIPTLDQYKLLYHILEKYSQTSSEYENLAYATKPKNT